MKEDISANLQNLRGRHRGARGLDGGLEVVDFKTGSPEDIDGVDQLDLYAVALSRLGVKFRGPLTLTYCYLADGTRDSRTITQAEADAALAAMQARLAQVG